MPKIGTIGKDFDVEAAIASDADVAILPYGLQKSASEAVQAKLEAAGIPVVYPVERFEVQGFQIPDDFDQSQKLGHVQFGFLMQIIGSLTQTFPLSSYKKGLGSI